MKHWFTHSISILSRTTSTGWRNETAWATSSGTTAIAGRVNPVVGMERYTADKQTLFATHKLFCSATEAITELNRVKHDGDTYDVIFVKDTLGLGHHKTIYLKEPV